ncbi:MAG: hypothetical protein M3H12_19255 [Chromatiales bacterium]
MERIAAPSRREVIDGPCVKIGLMAGKPFSRFAPILGQSIGDAPRRDHTVGFAAGRISCG